ncbi:hypothetical protein [Clostridium sp.]|uniref:hypothetical protein n=1 Tax=Clostridium sp. TaxID=1506 RepID=UPI0039EBFB8D
MCLSNRVYSTQQILQNSYGGNKTVIISSNPVFSISIDGADKDTKGIVAEIEGVLRSKFGDYFDSEMRKILTQLGLA